MEALMPDVLLAVVPAETDILHVTVDPAGLINQLADFFAKDSGMWSNFTSLVLAREMLRKTGLDKPTRDYWAARGVLGLATVTEDAHVQQALTAVLTSEQARDLTDLICDGLADLDGQVLYSMGLQDEPDRDWPARAVEERS
jgi:hypothetical protein